MVNVCMHSLVINGTDGFLYFAYFLPAYQQTKMAYNESRMESFNADGSDNGLVWPSRNDYSYYRSNTRMVNSVEMI